MTTDGQTDVGVVGGGPAGTALAMRLARLGYRVALLTDGRCRYGIQGLSERALTTLREIGAARASRLLKIPSVRCVEWNGRTASVNDEYLIERRTFDSALLEDAAEHGVEITLTRVPDVPRDGNAISVRSPLGVQRIGARFWIDARGRQSLMTATGPRGVTTLALQQSIACAPGAARSAVISVADGWFWVGVLPDGSGVVQQVLDSRHPCLSRVRRCSLLASPLAQSIHWREGMLAGATASSAVRGYPATSLLSAAVASPLRVGDALLATDPLSGQGVYEALGGSRNVAVAVNTLLRVPARRPLVMQFLADRARERFDTLARLTGHAYYQEERWTTEPFWAERRSLASGDIQQSRTAARVVDAAPVLDGEFVVPGAVLVTPTHPRGVWRYCDVPVVPFLRELRARRTCPEVARALGLPEHLAARVGRWLHEEVPELDISV